MSLFARAPAPRKGMPEVRLDEAEYKRRFCQQAVMRVTTPARQRFYD